MAISSTSRKAGPFTGNGTTTEFSFDFKVFDPTDVAVIRACALGVETKLVVGNDYAIALNEDQNEAPGGVVTLTAPLSAGCTLVLLSEVPMLQPVDITNQGGFYPDLLNDGLDRGVVQVQQLAEGLGRAIKLPVTADADDLTLPTPRGNQVLAWGPDGRSLLNLDPAELISVVTYGNTKADKFDGNGTTTSFTLSASPGSVNNLMVSIDGVVQVPGTDYTWGGGTILSFAVAPPAGTKVFVRYQEALDEGTDVSSKADRTAANLDPVVDALPFAAKLEEYRRPFDKPLMDFVTDINAADWKPYFDAAVDWAAANAPNGVRFVLPRNVRAGGIPLSYVKPILSDSVFFVGKGRAIWTGSFTASQDRCDIRQLASGSNPTFTWGNNAFNASVPGGFIQRGGGLIGLNIRGWEATSWVAVTKGVINPQFKDLWMWVPFKVIKIENGYDPELQRITFEAYRDTGIEINGTGVGTNPSDPREGRGDRGFAIDVLGSGEGTDSAPIAPNPGFAIRGYWGTFDCDRVRIVKGGGVNQSIFVGDRRNSDPKQRPCFITFNDTQVDYVRQRCIDIDDAFDVWFNGALYLNGSVDEQIRVGQNAYGVHFDKPRGYGSQKRMATIAGTNVTINGGDFRAWNQDGVSTEAAIYIEQTATGVAIEGVKFGYPLGSDTSANRLAVYAPPEATGTLSITGCAFFGLAAIPVDSGNMLLNAAGNVANYGFARLPVGASKVFSGVTKYRAGTHAFYGYGDSALVASQCAYFLNSYYDGSSFRRGETGPASFLKNESDGLGVYQVGSGASGSSFIPTRVARFSEGGSFKVESRQGVGMDPLPGNSLLATGGDISVGGAAPALEFNLYFDGGWKYIGNGPGAALKVVLDGSTPKLQLLTAPNNTGGAGAAAPVTAVGYLTATP